MKKIGILHGKERSFPEAFVERVNSKRVAGISAEPVKIDKAMQGVFSGYAVIFDRISQDVPFYRTWLKNAAVTGTAVINNPFWWSADDKYFNNCLMTQVNVPVPKTAILPSRDLPDDTSDESFSNLAFPLDWDSIFKYVGFPAYMKPFAGGGWKHVYKLSSPEEFFQKHSETGQLVMLLQDRGVIDCFQFSPVWIQQVTYIDDIKAELDGIPVFTNIGKDILEEFEIKLVSPWKLCAISFSILAFMFAQVFVLLDISKEEITLLLCTIRNTIYCLCYEIDFRWIFGNVDQVKIGSITIDVTRK